jgi:GT2 family glycosyltransferase
MNGFSVIIPTLNRSEFLKQTLDCLLRQEFEYPYEVLIVDQSDKEDKQILEYQKKYPFIRYCYITFFRGLPEARNFGWQKAKYDVILYLDDDITCENNLLREHSQYIINPEIGIVAGGITENFIGNSDCKTGKFNYWLMYANRGFHINKKQYTDHGGGGNLCIKKSVLQEIGGFDENLTKGAALYEETECCLRVKKAGYKVFFNYDAHVFHLAAPTGGCRVSNISQYVYNLSRNRSIVIFRHLKWYHKVVACLYSFKLIMAYTWTYKKITLFAVGIKGLKEGYKIEKEKVKCTIYQDC